MGAFYFGLDQFIANVVKYMVTGNGANSNFANPFCKMPQIIVVKASKLK